MVLVGLLEAKAKTVRRAQSATKGRQGLKARTEKMARKGESVIRDLKGLQAEMVFKDK